MPHQWCCSPQYVLRCTTVSHIYLYFLPFRTVNDYSYQVNTLFLWIPTYYENCAISLIEWSYLEICSLIFDQISAQFLLSHLFALFFVDMGSLVGVVVLFSLTFFACQEYPSKPTVIGHGLMLLLSIAKWHNLLKANCCCIMVTDRHHRIFWICFRKEQIWILTNGWCIISQYRHSHAGMPARHWTKDLLNPKSYF